MSTNFQTYVKKPFSKALLGGRTWGVCEIFGKFGEYLVRGGFGGIWKGFDGINIRTTIENCFQGFRHVTLLGFSRLQACHAFRGSDMSRF